MGGGKYTNEELATAYDNIKTIYLRQRWVLPYLTKLTKVGENDQYFWHQATGALKKALENDPELNEKINSNSDLLRNLSPKTQEEANEEQRLQDIRK